MDGGAPQGHEYSFLGQPFGPLKPYILVVAIDRHYCLLEKLHLAHNPPFN
jgi:hypothetical protein